MFTDIRSISCWTCGWIISHQFLWCWIRYM